MNYHLRTLSDLLLTLVGTPTGVYFIAQDNLCVGMHLIITSISPNSADQMDRPLMFKGSYMCRHNPIYSLNVIIPYLHWCNKFEDVVVNSPNMFLKFTLIINVRRTFNN